LAVEDVHRRLDGVKLVLLIAVELDLHQSIILSVCAWLDGAEFDSMRLHLQDSVRL
jgi:hypothetical protein